MQASELDAGELQQQDALRRHRRIAGACLLLALALYVATQFVEQPGFWVLLLRAGAEAGLIGGIADWFAVTALFRRPLGLPIPHTAIIPRNKDRLGEGLGRFIERNFLAPDLIRTKLAESDPAAYIGALLRSQDNSRMIAERLIAGAPYLLDSFQDREVREFYRDAFSQQLRSADLAPLIARVLMLAVESRQHQHLLDKALLLASEALRRNEALIYEKVETRSSWWIPRRFDRKLAQAIVGGVDEWLEELADHEHPIRHDFDRSTIELVSGLESSATFRARLEELKEQVLASEELQQALEAVWEQLRAMMLRELNDPDSSLTATLTRGLQRLGETLERDVDARQRVNRRIEVLLGEFVVPFRARIGGFIKEVVQGWDAGTVSARLEGAVGRDLQFIRINGTLVGALVGCVLFVLTRWIF